MHKSVAPNDQATKLPEVNSHVLDGKSNLVQYVVNQYDKLMSAFFGQRLIEP